MECYKVRELMPFLNDGSIKAETQDAVIKHLEECHACKKEYQETMDVLERVRRAIVENQPAPVPGYLEMVEKRIRRKKKNRTLFYRAVSVAAVIVLTVSFSLYSFVWRDTTLPVQEQYITEDSLDEFEEFMASQALTGYDLNELAETIDIDDKKTVVSELLVYNNTNITLEDIIELIDEDDLIMLFAELER